MKGKGLSTIFICIILLIALISSIVVLSIIINNINKSKCTDADIMAAKKQAIIGLSLSVVSTVIVIIIIGLVIYISGRTGGMI